MAGQNKTWVCWCGIANWWGEDCLQCGQTREHGWHPNDRRRFYAIRVIKRTKPPDDEVYFLPRNWSIEDEVKDLVTYPWAEAAARAVK